MGKRARVRSRSEATVEPTNEVGPRQPCPCGSGRRYKACHGSSSGPAPVRRPFEGIVGECDLIALRELVPAGTAPLSLKDSDRNVLLCSLLPLAAPALVRQDGSIWLGLQVQHSYGDPSRDLAAVLLRALDAEPGSMVGLTEPPGPGPRLQDLVDGEPLQVTVHSGFDYWVSDLEDPTAEAAALDRANAAVTPTLKLTSVEAAYWVDAGAKEHLRWVLPYDEDRLLDALARLHVAGRDRLVEGSRLVGMFRAHGLLTPVWDLAPATGAEALEEPAARFGGDLRQMLDVQRPLSVEERAARAGLANRQVTIR